MTTEATAHTAPQMPPQISAAINAVMKQANGVEKRGRNQFHNYDFAKVEDLLAKLQPAMADAGLFIIQSEHETSTLADGRLLRIQYAFKLGHQSGAVWSDAILHSGAAGVFTPKGHLDDKCVNKCHTAARKYFLLGLTQIPVGNMPDTDADDAPGADAARNAKPQPPKTPAPNGARAPAAPRNAEPARGGYGRQKNNVDAVGVGPSGGPQDGTERRASAAPIHPILASLDVLHGKLRSVLTDTGKYTSKALKGFGTKADNAWNEWLAQADAARAGMTDAQRAEVERAVAAFKADRWKITDAAVRNAEAEAAGADPSTGDVQYEPVQGAA